ncbi:DUF4241 domain-containing protein [Rhodococcoides fascians A21d2]|uniref:DUF4241 domain-containing protein n=1 Tax=Nocardiaceae TaxID=85025 RepID=UPI0013EF5998|nr:MULTISPECIES: DUF4241 domain-containing protein [Rhodococcus]QIH98492.1 DUF4241 domain-containing protein [Rhodococcus fascians A21d2]
MSWFASTVDAVQLAINAGALLGGAAIWKLYVDKLQAALTVKDAEISSVEKNRDMWRDKAQELEKRSPEVMERVLSERIQTRESEILRLTEDKDRNIGALEHLRHERANLEVDLSRTQGFRMMLAMDGDDFADDDARPDSTEGSTVPATTELEIVLLGEVGVDSGQLLITDPCYIDGEWRSEAGRATDHDQASLQIQQPVAAEGISRTLFEYSYQGCVGATLSGTHGRLAFPKGHEGAGVAFATAWGDGMYPVYGELHDGRIVRVYITSG